MLSPELTQATQIENNEQRSFVVVMRSRKTLLSFNTIFDIYLADVDRLINKGYPEYLDDVIKTTDPLYFGYIRLNHLLDRFRYFPSGDNRLHPDEIEELIGEMTFNTFGFHNKRKTLSTNV